MPSRSSDTTLANGVWGDSSILGKTLQLNMSPVRVVGVMPALLRTRLNRSMWANYSPDTTDGRAGRSKEVYALPVRGTRAQAHRR
jgi:hypothetical protein